MPRRVTTRKSACGKDLPRLHIVQAVDGRFRREPDLSARLGMPVYLVPVAEGDGKPGPEGRVLSVSFRG